MGTCQRMHRGLNNMLLGSYRWVSRCAAVGACQRMPRLRGLLIDAWSCLWTFSRRTSKLCNNCRASVSMQVYQDELPVKDGEWMAFTVSSFLSALPSPWRDEHIPHDSVPHSVPHSVPWFPRKFTVLQICTHPTDPITIQWSPICRHTHTGTHWNGGLVGQLDTR